MSLKDDLKLRGIKVADLAKDIEESYGNTYTALKMEAGGVEIRHKAVAARLEKIREYLGAEARAEERQFAEVESRTDGRMRERQRRRPVPEGHVAVLDLTIGDREIGPGSLVLLGDAFETETLPAGRYVFLRAVAHAETGAVREVDLYGGPGAGDKWFPRHRTLRPAAVGFPETVAVS